MQATKRPRGIAYLGELTYYVQVEVEGDASKEMPLFYLRQSQQVNGS